MISVQFIEFVKNGDSSSITYKKFNETPDDKYPSISICVYGANKSIRKIVKHSKTTTKSTKTVQEWTLGTHNESEFPFYDAYRESSRFCITKNNVDSNELISRDNIQFNLAELKKVLTGGGEKAFENDGFLDIYAHHPGQLVRSLSSFILSLNISELYENKNSLKSVFIMINKVEVLKQRADAAAPCNPDLLNEDMEWMGSVVSLVHCVPTYWKQYGPFFSNGETVSECKTHNELHEIERTYLPDKYNKNVTNSYIQPCKRMTIVTTTAVGDRMAEGQYEFQINYNVVDYLEITNNQAFDFESLFSQIGGFVGIFLGFSLLQVPDLIQHLTKTLQHMYQMKISNNEANAHCSGIGTNGNRSTEASIRMCHSEQHVSVCNADNQICIL